MAEYVELFMDQGTDFSITLTLTDDATQLSDNIAGYIITSSLRRSLLSVNTAATMICDLTNPNSGEFTISLDSANTANLRAGSYFFDVKVIDNTDSVSRLIEGVVFVQPGITR